jgi:hypothetical protein
MFGGCLGRRRAGQAPPLQGIRKLTSGTAESRALTLSRRLQKAPPQLLFHYR